MKVLDIIRHTIICFVAVVMIGAMFIGPKYALPMIMIWILTYGLLLPRDHKASGKTVLGEMKKIDAMADGLEFEQYTAKLFQAMGYRAYKTQDAGDFGADVIASKGKDRIAIQCKRYNQAVSIDACYQVLGGKAYYKCNKAMVITNSNFTEAAKQLAATADIELIDRAKLKQLIGNFYVPSAYNRSIEQQTIWGEEIK